MSPACEAEVPAMLAAMEARLAVLERSHEACVRVVGETTDRLEEANEARRHEIVELRRELTAALNDLRSGLSQARDSCAALPSHQATPGTTAARRW